MTVHVAHPESIHPVGTSYLLSRGWSTLGHAPIWIGTLVGLLVMACCATPVCSQEKQDMPWYNADEGKLVPLGLKDRPRSVTADRDKIPAAAPKKQSNPVNFGAGRGLTSTGNGLSFGVWLAAAVLLAVLVGLAVWAFYRGFDGSGEETLESRPQRTVEESIKQLPFEVQSATGDFRQLAWQAYQNGDLQTAAMLLFSHVLVALDQKGLIRLRRGKTNRDYLRELRPYASVSGFYGDVMVQFEKAFFGDYPVEKPEFERNWHGLEQFQAGLNATEVRTDV